MCALFARFLIEFVALLIEHLKRLLCTVSKSADSSQRQTDNLRNTRKAASFCFYAVQAAH